MFQSSLFGIFIWLTTVLGIITACGLAESEYEAYEREDGTGTDGSSGGTDSGTTDGSTTSGDDCPGSALTAWESNMKTTVDNRCGGASCHAQIDKLTLTSDQDETNRQTLFAYIAGDLTKLTSEIHVGTHPGGDFTSELPEGTISAWLTAETACQ